ncbi:phenoloxidase 1 [Halyomorpha halys]|uniref:phenoloxidase 1 n=1 Tax=Halyomorpha halys TaxID=286706 RepID=UPI0006D50268|nr:phenoloxidase 1-like [Halyomorpha halys]
MASQDLLKLFDRPTEPVFMPKGRDNTTFDIPQEFLSDRFKPLKNNLDNRFGSGKKIAVKKITLPDLSLPEQLGRRAQFSLFIPSHRAMAARLVEVFMGMRTLDDFISATVLCRDRMNPYMYIYALSVAIIHRPDTQNLEVPSFAEVFPDKYMNSEIFARAKEESNIVPEEQREPLEIPRDYTASDLEIEHRVAYFREDVGINLHHWHWHLVYPFDGPRSVVNKDRRGELFYYMHQQIMARYNMERLCNNLARVKRLINLREPLEEGYFPKLDSLVSSRNWPPRFSNTKLSDIYREIDQIKFDLQDLERWRDRIFAAIHSGTVVDEQGQFLELSETRGIDILGNLLEASILSTNRNLYGDLHNLGHVAIALCHDPEAKNLETFSIMGDPATAMRDPIFYRWHAFIDDIFAEHKNTLPRYTTQQLDFPGVRVTSVEIQTDGQNGRNRLATFWQQNDINLSRGLDFSPRGPVFARFTHLQHRPFTYKIQVENNGGNKTGTCRIFIAPKFDERGLPMLFRDQKNLFVELDKFTVNLKGSKNTITRKSTESSVTIPFEKTFRNLDQGRPADGDDLEQFNYCGCGWPQHMLICKGNAEGFPCQLFVMISNFSDDKVDQTGKAPQCMDAVSYCGIKNQVYPDKRSMGYPFDRLPRARVDTLAQFLTPNMRVVDVTVQHSNTTTRPQDTPDPRRG